MNAQLIFLTVLLTLTSFSLRVSAEQTEHGSETVDTANQRKEADVKLSTQAVNFISSYFWMPSNVVEEKYGKKMPAAMEKAIKEDESEISPIVTKLMGTINKKQTQRLAMDALDLRAKELEKAAQKETKSDERYVGMLDRFIWASLKAVPDMSDLDKDTKDKLKKVGDDPKAKEFNKSFDTEYAKIKEKNENTLEKIKQASEGNKEALGWIKENLDQKSLLKWAEGQKKNGNSAAAEKLVDAVSLKIGNQKVLEMTNGNETQRLYLGENKESLGKALDGLFQSPKKGGFGSAMLSFEQHPGIPAKQWFTNAKGEFVAGAPEGFSPSPVNNGPYIAATQTPAKPTGGSTGSVSSTQSTPSNANFAKFLAITQGKNCAGCHEQGDGIRGTSFSNMVITKGGQSKPITSFLANLGSMKNVFTPEQIQELKQLAGASN